MRDVKKLQEFLIDNKFLNDKADGIIGNKTIKAVENLLDHIKSPDKLPVKDIIINECKKNGFINTQIAYVLATVKHETNGTFKPVKEAYWLSEDWRKKNLRYYPYYGRGFVQITWKENYEKFSKITGYDLVNNPDLALEISIAAFILVYGFKYGSFTGKKISDFINKDKTDYVNCRRCINGLDKADLIAKYAKEYELSI